MSTSFLIMGLGANEIILIVIALLLLFGGKKIPELMRGLGKGVKEFKEGQKEDSSAEKKSEVEDNK
ncbi:twin-arginine translocase TatA/TatE family subunit [Sphingobacterium sp. ML3W]|jgi:twin arginine-targeting protein translocase, TatA/E family|uniref:Sec-independent protein translocase protein TatA n=2 Tax=Sphingobacterium TaxID=28453 RepID=A0A420AC81_SPHD1|nr:MULTISPECIES: twin-arginine translocase TatA/TatE family subunit [Sphingobacterium]MCS4227619.1 sec-independent protein translocase protein TatA [Sphingobacterium sp. BIGb0165]RKE42108.1 sec-independent protein translocase protein TatA [Sphingobacterium detergens]ULT22614.1 twin-arginine translocase TatA/TatE family subunit [Sphingobacterium sp. E70]WFA79026.1 twin-arginine translocase TatA/TatE family subunit [Sphingobacterium sp. ML3W]